MNTIPDEAIEAAEFNLTPTSKGFTLFEHWETGKDGKHYPLLVSSTPINMTLKPGDLVLRRAWAPASTPTLCNRDEIATLFGSRRE